MTANGLMAFWADIDEDYVLRYQQWHNCEHIPERVSIPGFLHGRRYRAENNRPRFLMFYETEGPDVFTSDAYLAALNAPTAWTREALTHFRNPQRAVYSLAATEGQGSPLTAPYIRALRFDLNDSEAERALSTWNEAVAASEGVQRSRIWKSDAAGSNVKTLERAIYGGGPGSQIFLALIELLGPPSEFGDPVRQADVLVQRLATSRRDDEDETYWQEIAYESPAEIIGAAA
jgi:hypothetical protein